MLFAELHNKFDVEALHLERSEDILTSSVLGTLLLADAGDVLCQWLAKTRGTDIVALPCEEIAYAFWPRLDGCVPDLLLLCGEHAILIEAKYRSGPSDAEDTPERSGRQLVRQWDALTAHPSLGALCGIAARQVRARVLVYLVNGNAKDTAAAVAAVKGARPEARVGVLYWQDLYTLLTIDVRAGNSTSSRWKHSLRGFLRRRALASYSGFSEALTPEVQAAARAIRRLWGKSSDVRKAVALVNLARVKALNSAMTRRHQWS